MREIQWAQVTVSKQYREHAFRKPPSTTMDGGWIKACFDPGQRSLFLPPVSSANTKEKGPPASREKNNNERHIPYWTLTVHDLYNNCSLHFISWSKIVYFRLVFARGKHAIFLKASLNNTRFSLCCLWRKEKGRALFTSRAILMTRHN